MTLNFNIPLYFSASHGQDSDIYWFLRNISAFFSDKKYSNIIDTIGIIPIIKPDTQHNEERVKIATRSKLAIISLQIDYNKYVNTNMEGRKSLIVENILSSVKKIEKRGDFNYNDFREDFLAFINHG